jgi:hypothetical protein
MVSMLMMTIKLFISLTTEIIVLSNGNVVKKTVKLLRVEMGKEIERIN